MEKATKEIVYDYEYFLNRAPYRKILENLCDLRIDSYRSSSGCHATQHYDISYDQLKFVQNLPEIKRRLLNTKFAKCVEDEAEYIKKIPDSLDEFKNAYAISRVASDLIADGCIRRGASSIRYTWEIQNRFSTDVGFNAACAAKMVAKSAKPIAKFIEVNGWERERWNFYFNFPNAEELELLDRLSKRLFSMPPVNQHIGKTYFELCLVPEEYDSVNWDCNRTHYMRYNNFVAGKLNTEKVAEVLTFSDDALFEFFYKGGAQNLFY